MKALHKRALTAALAGLLLAPGPAGAQHLTRDQEGRAQVAQCHATCMNRAQTTSLALYARADRLTDLLISDEYHALNASSQDALVLQEEDAICALAQDHVRALDGCYAGCTDIERVYGSVSALAKGRFRHLLLVERDALHVVGLWDNYNSSATSGEAFDAGCNRYWSGVAADGDPLSQIAALPRRVGHRAAPPVRAPAGGEGAEAD